MASSDSEREAEEEIPVTTNVPALIRSGARRAQDEARVGAEPPTGNEGTMERLKRLLDESAKENERLREQRQQMNESPAGAGEGGRQPIANHAGGNTQATTIPPLDVSKVLKHARHVRKLDCLHRSPTVWAEFYGDIRTASLSFPSLRACLAQIETTSNEAVDPEANHALFILLQATTTGLAHQIVTGLERSTDPGHTPSGINALKELRDAVQPCTIGDLYSAVDAVAVPCLSISSRDDPRATILTYTTNVRTIQNQYGIHISDDLVVSTILRALPPEYDTLCSNVMSRPVKDTRPTIQEIVERVNQHWTGVVAHRYAEAARYASEQPRVNMNPKCPQATQHTDECNALKPQQAPNHMGHRQGNFQAQPRGDRTKQYCTGCEYNEGKIFNNHSLDCCYKYSPAAVRKLQQQHEHRPTHPPAAAAAASPAPYVPIAPDDYDVYALACHQGHENRNLGYTNVMTGSTYTAKPMSHYNQQRVAKANSRHAPYHPDTAAQ